MIDLLDQKYYSYSHLIAQCAWIIANVASGDSLYVKDLVCWGIIPKIIQLLTHTNCEVQENAIWLASNLAGDGACSRNLLIQNKIAPLIAELERNNVFAKSVLPQVAWLISNLAGQKPYAPFYEVI